MTDATIRAARAEAKAFLEACDACLAELEELDRDFEARHGVPCGRRSRAYISGTKLSGALRRRSLELTRSLAELRRP